MATTPEGKVKKKLDEMFKKYKDKGVWFFSPQSGIYGRSGVPDRIACVAGRFISVEVKAPGKLANTTALQDQCGQEIMAAGGIWCVVDGDAGIEFVEGCIMARLTAEKLGVPDVGN